MRPKRSEMRQRIEELEKQIQETKRGPGQNSEKSSILGYFAGINTPPADPVWEDLKVGMG